MVAKSGFGDYIEELTFPTQPGLWSTRRLSPALFTGLRGRFVQCPWRWTVTEHLSPCSSRGPTGRSGGDFFNRTRMKSRHGECSTGCAAHLSTPRYNPLSFRHNPSRHTDFHHCGNSDTQRTAVRDGRWFRILVLLRRDNAICLVSAKVQLSNDLDFPATLEQESGILPPSSGSGGTAMA